MIEASLNLIIEEVNAYLNQVNGSVDEVFIILSSVMINDKPGIPSNKIGLSLINIQEDFALRNELPQRDPSGNKLVSNRSYNLSVLIAANFSEEQSDSGSSYSNALKKLSQVISFFDKNQLLIPSDDHSNVIQLQVVALNLNLEDMHHCWLAAGHSYLPSVAYKIRIVVSNT